MSGSYYTLDAKYNTLQAEIDAIIAGGGGGSQNLASVLAVGNSAGTFDINMNTRNITNVSLINGSPYPPAAPATPGLASVLTASNNAGGLNIINLGDLGVTTINGSAYPPVVPADTLQAVLTAGAIANLGFDLTLTTGAATASIKDELLPASSLVDVKFEDTTGGGITSSSIIKSQLNQTDYSTSVVDNTTGLTATKTLITIGGAVLNTDTATNGGTSQVGTDFCQVFPTSVATGRSYQQLGTTSSITTTNNATIAGQTHLLQIPTVGNTNVQLTAASGGTAGIACSYQSDPFDTFTQGEFSTNTGGATCSIQASSVASGVSQLLRMEAPLIGDAMLEHLVPGAGTQNLKIQSSNNILLTSDNLTSTATNLRMLSTGVGGALAPTLTLQNSNATQDTNPNIELNKTGRNLVGGEIIGSVSVWGLDATAQKTEFSRIQTKAEAVTTGNEDGTLSIFNSVNGVLAETFNFNGGQNENNSFRPLDLNGNNLRTSSGSLSVDTSSSSAAAAVLTLATKDNVAGSGAGLALTGNTLLSGSAGGSSGQHLCLTIGGVVYKIKLENP
jgi:hypothetical protein